ncbi:MAG: hypothetical protein M3Q16_01130 [Pseudomonadota bacterium]|nr:hypothetical protein [Pseudomonadota bacterium]
MQMKHRLARTRGIVIYQQSSVRGASSSSGNSWSNFKAATLRDISHPPHKVSSAPPPEHWRARHDEAVASAKAAETATLRAVYRELAQHYWSMHLWYERVTAG